MDVDRTGAVAAFAVAGLKWINDTLGHTNGDELLRAVGNAIREEPAFVASVVVATSASSTARL